MEVINTIAHAGAGALCAYLMRTDPVAGVLLALLFLAYELVEMVALGSRLSMLLEWKDSAHEELREFMVGYCMVMVLQIGMGVV